MSEAEIAVIEALKEAIKVSDHDPEAAHEQADEALTNFLDDLGYGHVVSLWDKVMKWYA